MGEAVCGKQFPGPCKVHSKVVGGELGRAPPGLFSYPTRKGWKQLDAGKLRPSQIAAAHAAICDSEAGAIALSSGPYLACPCFLSRHTQKEVSPFLTTSPARQSQPVRQSHGDHSPSSICCNPLFSICRSKGPVPRRLPLRTGGKLRAGTLPHFPNLDILGLINDHFPKQRDLRGKKILREKEGSPHPSQSSTTLFSSPHFPVSDPGNSRPCTASSLPTFAVYAHYHGLVMHLHSSRRPLPSSYHVAHTGTAGDLLMHEENPRNRPVGDQADCSDDLVPAPREGPLGTF